MTEPILTVTIDCSSLELDPIVINGDFTGGGWEMMPGYQMPGLQPQAKTVGATWLHGEPATSAKWINGIVSFDAVYIAEDAPEISAALAVMRRALIRTRFPVTTDRNGDVQTWKGQAGSITPSPLEYEQLRDDEQAYAISIPVHPIPTPGGV